MIIKLSNKNKIISKKAQIIKSIFLQFVGLRFSKQKDLIFQFRTERHLTIDMFFVFYPIDLIFLDENKKVIELKNCLKPFSFYRTKNKVMYFLELKKGIIKDNNIKLNDDVNWSSV